MPPEDLTGRSEPAYVGPKVELLGTYLVPDTPQDARLVAEILDGVDRKSDALRRGDWGEVHAIDQALTEVVWTSYRRAMAHTQRTCRLPVPKPSRPRAARPRRVDRSRAHRRRGPPSSDDESEPEPDVGLEPIGSLLATELIALAHRIAATP